MVRRLLLRCRRPGRTFGGGRKRGRSPAALKLALMVTVALGVGLTLLRELCLVVPFPELLGQSDYVCTHVQTFSARYCWHTRRPPLLPADRSLPVWCTLDVT